MSSIKCPHCGLVNWATAEDCKRCKLPLAAPAAAPPAQDTSDGGDRPHVDAPDGLGARPGADAPHETASHEAHTFAAEAPHEDSSYGPAHPEAEPLPFQTPPTTNFHATQQHAYGRDWRSPYDLPGADRDSNRLDINFEVAPFVDTAMVIRDTYALTRAQFRLILRIVLTAVVPQVLLILAFGATRAEAPAGLPPGMFSFGAPPISTRAGGVAPADLAGLFSLFLLLLLAYQFVRLAVMPSALVYGLVTTLNTGTEPGVFECFRWGFRRSFSTGLAVLLTGFLTFLGALLLVFPGVFLALSFSMVVPIIAIEGRGAIEAMGRSWDLSRGRRATIFFSTFAWSVALLLILFVATFFLGVVGAVLRSTVIGPITTAFVVEMAGATGVVLSLVVYLGVAHYGQAAPAPSSSSVRKTIIVLICIGALVVAGSVALVAAVAIPNFKASVRAANEASAISNMRKIVSAQETFFTLEDRYATLGELAEKKLIDEELAGEPVHGYRFEVEVVGGSYAATATPVTYGSTGVRSFYAGPDGVLRVADRRGRKAGPDDIPLNDSRPVRRPRRSSDSPIIDPGGREW